MNHLDVALAARAFESSRGIRRACVRHRRLVPDPLAVVLWQLGGEGFSIAALGWGDQHDSRNMAVTGEPRNRDLLFTALLRFARWFNPHFEAHAADRETVATKNCEFTVARTAPQVVIANRATVEVLGRIGRRLAYLPMDGPRPAPGELVRLGRHLLFLWDRFAFPGQQLAVALTDLLNDHWATPQSAFERQSLPALDAYIDPPTGVEGFAAAARAELEPIGPAPDGNDEQRLMPLVERFNSARAGNAYPGTIAPLLQPFVEHYRPLLRRAWDLLWRCRDRESALPEAASVGRRWDADRRAYTRHIDWLGRGGWRRTRQTSRQAATTWRDLEEAGRRLEAEEACDDPMRMAVHVLAHKAVRGTVTAIDPNHTERGLRKPLRRPLVTLRSPDPCLISIGRELWWSDDATGREFVLAGTTRNLSGGADVTLKLMSGSDGRSLPTVGTRACFSVHKTSAEWISDLPDHDPWTHQPPVTSPAVAIKALSSED